MFSQQTAQILWGAGAALAYGAAVIGVGFPLLVRFLGERRRVLGLWLSLWLGFIAGQGILGSLWLVLALAGYLTPTFVTAIIAVGCVTFFVLAMTSRRKLLALWMPFRGIVSEGGLGRCLAIGLGLILIARGAAALLPTGVEDALKQYLVEARVIAATQTLTFQYFLHPYYALQPLLVQLHWAALFTVANETAVTLWDYFCSVSFLGGIGVLAWTLTGNSRVAAVAMTMMLSTPAFSAMMGAAKIDNASAQYGLASFLCITIFPILGWRAAAMGGFCLGWSLAARYTNVILVPAFVGGFLAILYQNRSPGIASGLLRKATSALLVFGASSAIAGAPMLLKNQLLVGCPLAPQFGCQGSYWTHVFRSVGQDNLAFLDLMIYPFVWTFGTRPSMLGNISPLFLGALPALLLMYAQSNEIRRAALAGMVGLLGIAAWLLIEPYILFTRLLLVPLALLCIPLAASLSSFDDWLVRLPRCAWLCRGAFAVLVLLLLFDSREVVYAGRYISGTVARAEWYRAAAGYDVAEWLTANVREGDRVALASFKGHRYFLPPNLLFGSESTGELQWLWERWRWKYNDAGSIAPAQWTEEIWRYLLQTRFTYVVVGKDRLADARRVWPKDISDHTLETVLVGRENDILRLTRVVASGAPVAEKRAVTLTH